MLKAFVFALAALTLSTVSITARADDATTSAGGESEAPLPRSIASPIRILPVIGQSSFTTNSTVSTKNFSNFSAGIFGDLGEGKWNFETGLLTLNSSEQHAGDSAAVSVNTWGIPLLAKLNFSGHPHQTIFLKAGAMPFTASGGSSSTFDVMGVAGLGGNIPLGRSSSIVLDASYNRLFTRGGDLTNYQGIALLAGLSLNI